MTTHKVGTPYHPQTSGQIEVSNREVKHILEKIVRLDRKYWSTRLVDALWAYRTAHKTPIGMSLYRIVFEKPYHLPIQLEHRALWAIRKFNFDIAKTGDHRKLQLNELEELHNDVYKSSKIYKARTKTFHNKHISRKSFEPHQKVWLFNAKLQLFPGKLRFQWDGLYEVIEAFLYGAVEVKNPQDGTTFKVNGQSLKHYVDGTEKEEMIEICLHYPTEYPNGLTMPTLPLGMYQQTLGPTNQLPVSHPLIWTSSDAINPLRGVSDNLKIGTS
ncbi:uncharacterized protein LOC114280613 [Camellia sinensis]|uniref:uncharacterized protein LOC114280613 n=1 Tax=Camellia sinensis TaxID=4442 RepID=UPI001035A8A4|nr:uncharacterized protein LOC114280613 [Camellia sinensis]